MPAPILTHGTVLTPNAGGVELKSGPETQSASVTIVPGEVTLPDRSVERLKSDALRAAQSDRASKPRPRTGPTHRSEVVKAMARARKDGKTLPQFLAAVENENDDGIRITANTLAGGLTKYAIECDAVTADKPPVAFKTLKDWWAEAASGTGSGAGSCPESG